MLCSTDEAIPRSPAAEARASDELRELVVAIMVAAVVKDVRQAIAAEQGHPTTHSPAA